MTEPLSLQEIESAAATIAGDAVQTPVVSNQALDDALGVEVFCKFEGAQQAGSFKFRGALNRLHQIPIEERAAGVVAVSSGNHGAAVARAAKLLSLPAVVFIPTDAPAAKRKLIVEAGAEVVTFDRMTDDREALAAQRVAADGSTFIHPFEDRLVQAGQGTAALELHNEVGALDRLYVPVGGGGLMAGSSSALAVLDPDCVLIGVEPAAADDTRRSFAAGKPVAIDQPVTIADGLAVRRPGTSTFAINYRLASEIRTVTEQQIAAAMKLLHQTLGLVVEPSGAVGIAALMTEHQTESDRVGVIITGGNVDQELFEQLISASEC